MITLWYRDKLPLWACVLIPLTWLYRFAFCCHKQMIQLISSRKRYSVPIIVVGNLTVGGVGKTPVVIALARWLKSIGFRPGIILRGYRRKTKGARFVQKGDHPDQVGDEAVLLHQKTDCPVSVAHWRTQAIDLLLAQTNVDIILSDDGLQHHALKADFEIALVDPQSAFGNGYCLPLGPLREPIERLQSVDFVLRDFKMLMSDSIYALSHPDTRKALSDFKGQTVHAVAGIGRPEKFFRELAQAGLHVIAHPFPDHHDFKPADLTFAEKHPILITEKDAVKLACLPLAPDLIWVVPMRTEINPSFKTNLLKKIQEFQHDRKQAA